MIWILSVLFGGSVGTWLRFVFSNQLGIFVINIIASFLLGLAIAVKAQGAWATESVYYTVWLGWTVGLCGSLSTFSTFSMEALQLLRSKKWYLAGAYITGTVAFSVLAVVSGFWIAGLFV